jgi:hypothetical protein
MAAKAAIHASLSNYSVEACLDPGCALRPGMTSWAMREELKSSLRGKRAALQGCLASRRYQF